MADSQMLRGWKWDNANNYLELWVNGEHILHISNTADVIYPGTDDTYSLGSSTAEFDDLYIDGTANIDTLAADAATLGATTMSGDITMGSGLSITGGSSTGANYKFDVACSTGDDTIMTIQGATGSVGKWGLFGKAAVQQSTIAAAAGSSANNSTLNKVIAVLDSFGLTATA